MSMPIMLTFSWTLSFAFQTRAPRVLILAHHDSADQGRPLHRLQRRGRGRKDGAGRTGLSRRAPGRASDLDPVRGNHAGPRPQEPHLRGRTHGSARRQAFRAAEIPGCAQGGVHIRELERLREEDRRREERLTSLVTDLSSRPRSLTAQLERERKQNGPLEEKMKSPNSSLNQVQTDLQGFKKDLSGLMSSLRKL